MSGCTTACVIPSSTLSLSLFLSSCSFFLLSLLRHETSGATVMAPDVRMTKSKLSYTMEFPDSYPSESQTAPRE